MNENLKLNYISLALCVFMAFFVGFMCLLLGESMPFPLKMDYAILTLVIFELIVFNAITIIKKLNIEEIK